RDRALGHVARQLARGAQPGRGARARGRGAARLHADLARRGAGARRARGGRADRSHHRQLAQERSRPARAGADRQAQPRSAAGATARRAGHPLGRARLGGHDGAAAVRQRQAGRARGRGRAAAGDAVSAPLAAAASPAARLLLLLVVVTSIATLPLASRSALVMAALAAAACVGLGRPSPRRLLFGVLSVVAMSSAVAAPALMHGEWLAAGRYGGRAAMAAVAALSLSASIGAAELGPALRTIGVPRGLASVIETMLRQVQAVQLEGSRIL